MIPRTLFTIRKIRAICTILAGALAGVIALDAFAQSWPARPVRIIVPFPPGNASDLAARGISDALTKRIGQPVIVDNRAGASGLIGSDAVAKAPADGHTLLLTSSAFGVTPAVIRKMPYDVERDFTPVSLIAWTAMILVSEPGFAAKNVAELVRELKAQPGKIQYAHIGSGSLSHMVMELFKIGAGVDSPAVPYKGSGQAIADILGGQLPLMFDGITSAYPHVKAGRLRGLAVSSKEPSRFAPGVPPLADSGVPGLRDYDVKAWIGMLAAAATPAALVDRINAEVGEVLRIAEIRERLLASNLDPFEPHPPAQAASFLKVEFAKWARVAREARIEPQ